ncbi:MAG TPA: carboxymuconolactone decarboxylase family protein [Blastococcus sp.]|nr:carboxymuconolactone decarboxylase family protein [Blastococcus sp.]
MNRRHAPDPAAAALQSLLPPVGGVPRVPPAPVRQLRPLARLVAVVSGRLTGTEPTAIFTTLGRHPRLFRAWLRYSAHLMPFGSLPRRDSELIILRVAWQCRAVYEWWHHVPLALRAGLTAEEIAGIADVNGDAALSERQHVLVAITDGLLEDRALSDATWQAARRIVTDREAIEVCLLIGHYQGLASAIGGLAIQLERDLGPEVTPGSPIADDTATG